MLIMGFSIYGKSQSCKKLFSTSEARGEFNFCFTGILPHAGIGVRGVTRLSVTQTTHLSAEKCTKGIFSNFVGRGVGLSYWVLRVAHRT